MNDASVALAARVVLAIVLAASAFAKLRSRDAVRRQVETLVSVRAAPVVSSLLPLTELAVGWSLVAYWNVFPGLAAVILLALFTVVLVRAQARRIPCLCFGAATLDTPAGPWSIVRNGVLAALAVLAIGSPQGASSGATLAVGVVFGVAAGLAVRAAR